MLSLAAALVWLGLRIHGRADQAWDWDWSLLAQYLVRRNASTGAWEPALLLQGLLATIRLSAWAAVLACCLGLAAGILRTRTAWLPRLVAGVYVETVRNMPPLVLLFLIYFFLSDTLVALSGLEDWLRSLPAPLQRIVAVLAAPAGRIGGFVGAVTALAVYEGAYVAEIIRAGIQSVGKGQWDAARALGLTPWLRLRHVILPQATVRILPPLAGQLISLIKDSAIVAVISVPELTFQGLELMATTMRTLEIWTMIAALYFLLCLGCSLTARRLERRLRRRLE